MVTIGRLMPMFIWKSKKFGVAETKLQKIKAGILPLENLETYSHRAVRTEVCCWGIKR